MAGADTMLNEETLISFPPPTASAAAAAAARGPVRVPINSRKLRRLGLSPLSSSGEGRSDEGWDKGPSEETEQAAEVGNQKRNPVAEANARLARNIFLVDAAKGESGSISSSNSRSLSMRNMGSSSSRHGSSGGDGESSAIGSGVGHGHQRASSMSSMRNGDRRWSGSGGKGSGDGAAAASPEVAEVGQGSSDRQIRSSKSLKGESRRAFKASSPTLPPFQDMSSIKGVERGRITQMFEIKGKVGHAGKEAEKAVEVQREDLGSGKEIKIGNKEGAGQVGTGAHEKGRTSATISGSREIKADEEQHGSLGPRQPQGERLSRTDGGVETLGEILGRNEHRGSYGSPAEDVSCETQILAGDMGGQNQVVGREVENAAEINEERNGAKVDIVSSNVQPEGFLEGAVIKKEGGFAGAKSAGFHEAGERRAAVVGGKGSGDRVPAGALVAGEKNREGNGDSSGQDGEERYLAELIAKVSNIYDRMMDARKEGAVSADASRSLTVPGPPGPAPASAALKPLPPGFSAKRPAQPIELCSSGAAGPASDSEGNLVGEHGLLFATREAHLAAAAAGEPAAGCAEEGEMDSSSEGSSDAVCDSESESEGDDVETEEDEEQGEEEEGEEGEEEEGEESGHSFAGAGAVRGAGEATETAAEGAAAAGGGSAAAAPASGAAVSICAVSSTERSSSAVSTKGGPISAIDDECLSPSFSYLLEQGPPPPEMEGGLLGDQAQGADVAVPVASFEDEVAPQGAVGRPSGHALVTGLDAMGSAESAGREIELAGIGDTAQGAAAGEGVEVFGVAGSCAGVTLVDEGLGKSGVPVAAGEGIGAARGIQAMSAPAEKWGTALEVSGVADVAAVADVDKKDALKGKGGVGTPGLVQAGGQSEWESYDSEGRIAGAVLGNSLRGSETSRDEKGSAPTSRASAATEMAAGTAAGSAIGTPRRKAMGMAAETAAGAVAGSATGTVAGSAEGTVKVKALSLAEGTAKEKAAGSAAGRRAVVDGIPLVSESSKILNSSLGHFRSKLAKEVLPAGSQGGTKGKVFGRSFSGGWGEQQKGPEKCESAGKKGGGLPGKLSVEKERKGSSFADRAGVLVGGWKKGEAGVGSSKSLGEAGRHTDSKRMAGSSARGEGKHQGREGDGDAPSSSGDVVDSQLQFTDAELRVMRVLYGGVLPVAGPSLSGLKGEKKVAKFSRQGSLSAVQEQEEPAKIVSGDSQLSKTEHDEDLHGMVGAKCELTEKSDAPSKEDRSNLPVPGLSEESPIKKPVVIVKPYRHPSERESALMMLKKSEASRGNGGKSKSFGGSRSDPMDMGFPRGKLDSSEGVEGSRLKQGAALGRFSFKVDK